MTIVVPAGEAIESDRGLTTCKVSLRCKAREELDDEEKPTEDVYRFKWLGKDHWIQKHAVEIV